MNKQHRKEQKCAQERKCNTLQDPEVTIYIYLNRLNLKNRFNLKNCDKTIMRGEMCSSVQGGKGMGSGAGKRKLKLHHSWHEINAYVKLKNQEKAV